MSKEEKIVIVLVVALFIFSFFILGVAMQSEGVDNGGSSSHNDDNTSGVEFEPRMCTGGICIGTDGTGIGPSFGPKNGIDFGPTWP